MNISTLAKNFYLQHFDELSDEKKFHFATRMKNFFKISDFDSYLQNNIPNQNLAEIFANNDFSRVNFYEQRKPFFEKYDHLYAIEAALFRVNHLKNEYDIDIRQDFLNFYSREKLYALSDALSQDDTALRILSTFAINVICLTEILFPRERNVIKELAQKSLSYDDATPLMVYLNTHIILCDTNFYTRPVQPENLEILRQLIAESAQIIRSNYDEISLDIKLEFLVCAKLVDFDAGVLIERIQLECSKNIDGDFLKDPSKPFRLNTLDGAEHRNVLLIMSGI